MAQFGSKNSPWGRPAPQQQLNPQIFTGQLSGMNAFAVSQAMGLGAAGLGALGGGVMSSVNPAAFASQQPTAAALAGAVGFPAANAAVAAAVSRQQQQVAQAVAHQQQQQKNQRTFIGTVTKLHENYGFVDDDVFFQTSVVRGAMPRIGDRVMAEASYNANMPFKWNAIRIQLLPNQEAGVPQQQQQQMPGRHQQGSSMRHSRGDDRWPTDRRESHGSSRRERSPPPPRRSPPPARRSSPPRRSSPRRRTPSPARQSSGSFPVKRERSPAVSTTSRDTGMRGGSRSPPRRRPRVATTRSQSVLPKIPLDTHELGVFSARKLYPNLYVPSDFFHCNYDWTIGLPQQRPLSLEYSASYHIMNKEVDCLDGTDAVFDPPDVDYTYSAKVMLLSLPGAQEFYKKTIGLEATDGFLKSAGDFGPAHVNNVVGFLVGMRGKNEVMSIGGPWSPSLDGADPEDPKVMIRCAIRTTKALTGIDLSKCTQWYKFLEIRYRRWTKPQQQQMENTDDQEAPKRDRISFLVDSSPRLETVIIFLPDVWRVVPSKLEFEVLQSSLKQQLETKIAALYEPIPVTPPPPPAVVESAIPASTPAAGSSDELPSGHLETPTVAATDEPMDTSSASAGAGATAETDTTTTTATSSKPEGEEEEKPTNAPEKEPTHWNQLNIKAMKVNELKAELSARGIDPKGIKSQLVAQLMKAAKAEQEAEEQAKIEEEAKATAAAKEAEAGNETQHADETTAENKEEAMESIQDMQEVEKLDESDQQMEVQQNEENATGTVQAEQTVQEEPKPRMRDEKEMKEMKHRLERAYDFRPNHHGILVHPNRTAKGGKFDCRVMSLSSLLDYRQEDNKEHSFEVSLFAEAFSQMITRDCAFKIFKSMLAAADPEEEKKLTEVKEEAANKTDTAETENTTETEGKEEGAKEGAKDGDKKDGSKPSSAGKKDSKQKDDKEKTHSPSSLRDDKKLVKPNDPALLQAFMYFDPNCGGYLVSKDLEDIVLSLGTWLARSQVQKLMKKVTSRDVLHYRKLTDIVFSKATKEKIWEPFMLALPSDEELAAGNTGLICKKDVQIKSKPGPASSKIRKSEAVDVTAVGTVAYKGSIVDIGQVLNQIEKLDQERKTLEQRLSTVSKESGDYKDQKHALERRKRRLEDDLKDVRKRLYDAEKCLKNSQDDTVQLKTSLHRCKEYSESIARLVDRTLPSKREKEDTSSERSTKSGKSKSAADKKTSEGPTEEGTAASETANASTENVEGDAKNVNEVKLDSSGMAPEEQSPSPDELTVREEVTETDRTEADLNILSALSEENAGE